MTSSSLNVSQLGPPSWTPGLLQGPMSSPELTWPVRRQDPDDVGQFSTPCKWDVAVYSRFKVSLFLLLKLGV